MMRNYLLAAVAAGTLLASPAAARDGQWYVGIEGGLLFPNDSDFDVTENEYFLGNLVDSYDIDNFVEADHKLGFDLDAIAGYDFGMVRLEAELGYKRAGVKKVTVNDPEDDEATIDGNGHVTATSIMANLLFDFGNEDGWSFYAGPGIGLAWVNYSNIGATAPPPPPAEDYGHFSGKDKAVAWQLIAGARAAISDNVSLGLKYRYFQTGRLDLGRVASVGGACQIIGIGAAAVPDCGETFDAKTRFSSHSLLASLTYDFGVRAAPPPPPPPPPPPVAPAATQTCYDGSVILATDICPSPPPPPPAAAPERG